jgi:hypothetical protein
MESNNDLVFEVRVDEYGELVSVTLDGKRGVEECERPEGSGTVLYSIGKDPENGEGIEIVQFEARRCIHYYCRWICF